MSTSAFLPAGFDPADFAQIEPLYQQLLARDLSTREALEQFLADLSALDAAIDEYGSRRHIDYTCHTDDPEIEKHYLHFIEQIAPKLKPIFFQVQKQYLASPARGELRQERYRMLDRAWQAEVELFRQENVPLQTRVTKLASEYGKICGAMLVEFEGRSQTLQQMARYLEETDRPVREQVWRLVQARRLADREPIAAIFAEQLTLRQQMAMNAGLPDYRAYAWKSRLRFDYQPEDCLAFGDAVAKLCLPLVEELDRQRRADLTLEVLRPWDLSVDVHQRPPLRPFAENDIEGLVARTGEVFRRMPGCLGEQFATLKMGSHLDLGSRKGKQPGGYQSSLEVSLQPFIFMNAAGLQDDVHTLLHEGGHAFHYLESRQEPLIFVRHAPLEFCEVASMSMELLGSDHFEVFYPGQPELAGRAKRDLLEGIIRLLPWVATIDGFQHWLYTHPGHSAEQRRSAWLEILARFSSRLVDWTGLEDARADQWQRQGHLFRSPFYYIEYGIAQLGALQVWLDYRRDPQAALTRLTQAFRLGGTAPLPQLFATAGLRFDFSEQTIAPLMEAVGAELSKLPA